MADRLPMWVIYDHPLDFPAVFMARKWIVRAGQFGPSDAIRVGDTLKSVREQLHADGFSVIIPRDPGDDPKIVEVWL